MKQYTLSRLLSRKGTYQSSVFLIHLAAILVSSWLNNRTWGEGTFGFQGPLWTVPHSWSHLKNVDLAEIIIG